MQQYRRCYNATAQAGADINLFSAWKYTTGRPEVVVAVVDEGVCYTHPDLKDSFLVNEVELNGQEGVDDDENGYVDDIYGYNFKDKGSITWSKGKDTGHPIGPTHFRLLISTIIRE